MSTIARTTEIRLFGLVLNLRQPAHNPERLPAERPREASEIPWALPVDQATRVESSCDFYWAEAWVHRCFQDLDCALENLDQAAGQLA